MRIVSVVDIAAWRMCIGCGVCAAMEPPGTISLVNMFRSGIRPAISSEQVSETPIGVSVCPGLQINREQRDPTVEYIESLAEEWGPIIEIWEGHATDPEIRNMGSSGGLSTALALYCIENGEADGVIHIGQKRGTSCENETVMSRNRSDLIERSGSRYAPASPGEGLRWLQEEEERAVFVGKPCDVAGARRARATDQTIHQGLSLLISIFCAGTPSTQGTLDLMRDNGITPSGNESVRYRGVGWPGNFTVRREKETHPAVSISYADSWHFLQAYRPYRCYLCPDGTGELSDLSCGDPWYREPATSAEGSSLLLVRTKRGQDIVRGAVERGYVDLTRVTADILPRSQENLLNKRRAIRGRLFAMRSVGIPAPRYPGFGLLISWRKLAMKEKIRSVVGTYRRILSRRYWIASSEDIPDINR